MSNLPKDHAIVLKLHKDMLGLIVSPSESNLKKYTQDKVNEEVYSYLIDHYWAGCTLTTGEVIGQCSFYTFRPNEHHFMESEFQPYIENARGIPVAAMHIYKNHIIRYYSPKLNRFCGINEWAIAENISPIARERLSFE